MVRSEDWLSRGQPFLFCIKLIGFVGISDILHFGMIGQCYSSMKYLYLLLASKSIMKDVTEKYYQEKSNYIFDYISSNLHKRINLKLIATNVNVSQRQVFRIMQSFLGESLYSYIARQRLERAIMIMQIEDVSLSELAEKVGYSNSQSFSKAFKKQYGISPKAYMQRLKIQLEDYNKNTQVIEMPALYHSDICQEDGVKLVYIRIIGKYGEAESYEIAWKKLTLFLRDNDLLSKQTRFIGLSFDDPNVTESVQCRFYACASVDKYVKPQGEIGYVELKKGKYAVYTLKGSYSMLQTFYNNINLDAGCSIRYGLTFEEYLNSPLDTDEKDLLTKIYIPIK